MPHDSSILIVIITSVFASTGFWSFLNVIYQNNRTKHSVERDALLGLLHERLTDKCNYYITRGWVSFQDYEDLMKYIYNPYKELGGNGYGEEMFKRLGSLKNSPPEEE